MNPHDLNEAITLIRNAQIETVTTSDFAWDRLYRARKYLEKQLEEYFAEEVA